MPDLCHYASCTRKTTFLQNSSLNSPQCPQVHFIRKFNLKQKLIFFVVF